MIERIFGKTWIADLFNSRHEPGGSAIGGQFARAADTGAGAGGGTVGGASERQVSYAKSLLVQYNAPELTHVFLQTLNSSSVFSVGVHMPPGIKYDELKKTPLRSGRGESDVVAMENFHKALIDDYQNWKSLTDPAQWSAADMKHFLDAATTGFSRHSFAGNIKGYVRVKTAGKDVALTAYWEQLVQRANAATPDNPWGAGS